MSRCVSADCVGVTETVGVSVHARILGGLRTSACGAGGREPCLSLERKVLADLSRGTHRHTFLSVFTPRVR